MVPIISFAVRYFSCWHLIAPFYRLVPKMAAWPSDAMVEAAILLLAWPHPVLLSLARLGNPLGSLWVPLRLSPHRSPRNQAQAPLPLRVAPSSLAPPPVSSQPLASLLLPLVSWFSCKSVSRHQASPGHLIFDAIWCLLLAVFCQAFRNLWDIFMGSLGIAIYHFNLISLVKLFSFPNRAIWEFLWLYVPEWGRWLHSLHDRRLA